MAIVSKISVRLTLKELRCEFSSSFDIISGSEEGGILFLQIAVVIGMKKKSSLTGIVSQTRKKKTIQQFNKK